MPQASGDEHQNPKSLNTEERSKRRKEIRRVMPDSPVSNQKSIPFAIFAPFAMKGLSMRGRGQLRLSWLVIDLADSIDQCFRLDAALPFSEKLRMWREALARLGEGMVRQV